MAARAQRIPVVPRADDAGRADALQARHRHRRHARQDHHHLAGRQRAGEGGLDPTFVIGGKLLAPAPTRARQGEWLVAEADESDGSFLRLNPVIAVVTNIDADHSRTTAATSPREGRLRRIPAPPAVLRPGGAVHRRSGSRALAADTPRHVTRYGFAADADVRAERRAPGRRRMRFTLHLPMVRARRSSSPAGPPQRAERARRGAIGWQLGVRPKRSRTALAKFQASAAASTCKGNCARPGRHGAAGRRLRPPPEGTRSGVRRRARRLAGQAPGRRVPAASLQPHARPVRRFRAVLSASTRWC
jgi:UDP-N-acetylmuramate--alanine ligase